jgi:hypothetical protein
MMFVIIVGHASFQTTGNSGPSTIERSYFLRFGTLAGDAGCAAEVADRDESSTAGRVTTGIYCSSHTWTGDPSAAATGQD